MKGFTAIDVELANTNPNSICEIGAVRFRNGVLIETWKVIVNPHAEFGTTFQSNLHGITEAHVQDAPTFPEIYPTLVRFVAGEICVTHSNSGFDENCLRRACQEHGLEDITQSGEWRSTVSIARTFFPGMKNYKLETLCREIGHEYEAHNALEDAMASAAVVLNAAGHGDVAAISGIGGRPDRPRTYRKSPKRRRQTGLHGNPDGPFYQTRIVVTGIFSSPWQDRSSLEQHLHQLGFALRGGVTGKTEILVVGSGPGPSKIKKAEELGTDVMDEASFWEFVKSRS